MSEIGPAERLEKSRLRKALRVRRAKLSPTMRAEASQAAAAVLTSSPFVTSIPPNNFVALYAALDEEADPLALEAPLLARGLIVAYPRVRGDLLEFAPCERSALVRQPPWNIPEPPEAFAALAPDALALIIVPALGFGPLGQRLGHGRGYYDRALAAARDARPEVRCVGFGFSCQVVYSLPSETHDQRLDAVVTELGLQYF